MKITYIGHACFHIEDNSGHTLAIDPYKPGSVPGLSDHGLVADEVICSHNHYDHDAGAYIAAGWMDINGKHVRSIDTDKYYNWWNYKKRYYPCK